MFTPTAVAVVTRSSILRSYLGEDRLGLMLWESFGAYNNESSMRTTKEDAYMLESAVILDKKKQAKAVYDVIISCADRLGRYTKFCNQNIAVGDDFHSGSCAAVYNALECYKLYKNKIE